MTVVHIVKREEAPSLLAIERVRDQLAQARSLEDVKRIGDIARAMAAAGRAIEAGKAIAIDAGDVVVRADRMMGELVAKLPKAPDGKRRGLSESDDRTQKKKALASIGVTKQRASECERAAKLPEKDYDAYVSACRKVEQAPTTSSVVKLARLDPLVRKKVLATLGDVPNVQRAITAAGRRVADDPPKLVSTPVTETWSETDEIAALEINIWDVLARWQGKNLMPLVDALVMAQSRVEKEHARRNRNAE